MHQASLNESRERAADTHGEEIAADDSGKLENAVADQVAGQRARNQFVDQAAGGDEEDGDEQQQGHGLCQGNCWSYPCTAAAMIRQRPMESDPIRIASAILCSCTTSFHR